jgi:hypothetical protein
VAVGGLRGCIGNRNPLALMQLGLAMSSDNFQGRKPDFILHVKVKETDKTKRRCGVAWKNKAGGISIQLDPCTVISWRDNVFISLFSEKWSGKRDSEKPGVERDDTETPF